MNGVSLDMGSSQIKMVYMRAQRVQTAVCEAAEPGASLANEQSARALGAQLAQMRKRAGIPACDASLVISGSDAVIRLITLPLLPPAELMENVRYEIESYLPVDMNMYTLDYRALETTRVEKGMTVTLMVAAVQNTLVELAKMAIRLAGFTPRRMDVADNAREKMLAYAYKGARQPNTCFVDIGARRIKIAIYDEGRFFINKVLEGGSDALSRLLSERLGLTPGEAEHRKRSNTIWLYGAMPEPVREALVGIMEDWSGEVGRVAEFYSRKTGRPRVAGVYLLGGGASMPGCDKFFSERLGVPVARASASVMGGLKGLPDGHEHLFFDAVGAALWR